MDITIDATKPGGSKPEADNTVIALWAKNIVAFPYTLSSLTIKDPHMVKVLKNKPPENRLLAIFPALPKKERKKSSSEYITRMELRGEAISKIGTICRIIKL